MLTGLSQINIELSSFCDRATLCGFCGHQDRKTNPNLKFGHMDFVLLESIAGQVPPGIIASFHRDGDSLVHPRLRDALKAFSHCIRSVVTHGETLNERADDVIENCDTITVSVIPNDKDRDIQIDSVWRFLLKKGGRSPQVQLKFVGHIDDADGYVALGVPIIGRTLHSKKGSFKYHRIDPVIPEVRVCLNFLGSPTIDWRGRVFQCNRLDPSDEGLIGDLNTESLDAIWNGPERMRRLREHLRGRRDLASSLCSRCDFWGIPTPGE